MNAKGTLAAVSAELLLDINDAVSEEGVIDVSGTFTGLTLLVEGSADGATFRTLAITPVGGGADVTSISAAGAWRANFAGCKKARVRCTAIATGSAAIAAGTTRRA